MYPINPFMKFLNLLISGMVNGNRMLRLVGERRIFNYFSIEDFKEEA